MFQLILALLSTWPRCVNQSRHLHRANCVPNDMPLQAAARNPQQRDRHHRLSPALLGARRSEFPCTSPTGRGWQPRSPANARTSQRDSLPPTLAPTCSVSCPTRLPRPPAPRAATRTRHLTKSCTCRMSRIAWLKSTGVTRSPCPTICKTGHAMASRSAFVTQLIC